MTVRELLAHGRARLTGLAFASPREAHLLLGHLLGLGEASLLARDEMPLDAALVARFDALLTRRIAGEPVAYLTGRREFFGREFRVDARVLVPRPETEHLVEAALAIARELPSRPRILDLGTGSGCIAVTLALELPEARVTGTDRSAGALAVAARNARELGAPVALVAGDWSAPLAVAAFDLIVSNPPYLDPRDAAVQPEVARHEPASALWAGDRGMQAYRALLASVADARPGTPLLLELGAGQLASLRELAPPLWSVEHVDADLAGIARVCRLRRR
jgi:release factor glutamine methyltransferase